MPWAIFIRDAGFMAATLGAWCAADAWQGAAPGLGRDLLAIVAGVLLSLVWGYAIHEWGHLAAAWASGARVYPSSNPASAKLFAYVKEENSDRQFLWLTAGGLGALWLQVVGFVTLFPWRTPAGLAAILFAIGGAIFTTAKEAPIGLRVASSGLPAHRS